MADSTPTWRDEQKAAFGQRLKTTRKRMKDADGRPLYPSAVDFITALEARLPHIQGRMYYHYEAGRSVPREPDTINRIAEMLGVTPRWLLFGSEDEVNADSLKESPATINQVLEIARTTASKSQPLRYIPILSASQIKMMLLGNGNHATMSREQLPVPQHIEAGAEAFYYQIPDDDHSMVGTAGFSFPPRTMLLIDPGRAIKPGDFLLAQVAGDPAPIMRRLKARVPIDPAKAMGDHGYPFQLLALNPLADPIEVNKPSDCEIIGRIVSFTQIL